MEAHPPIAELRLAAMMEMGGVEHAAGLFGNRLAASFYEDWLSGYPAFSYFLSSYHERMLTRNYENAVGRAKLPLSHRAEVRQEAHPPIAELRLAAMMKMRDVEHAAGLFGNGLAASLYENWLSAFWLSGFLLILSTDRDRNEVGIDVDFQAHL